MNKHINPPLFINDSIKRIPRWKFDEIYQALREGTTTDDIVGDGITRGEVLFVLSKLRGLGLDF